MMDHQEGFLLLDKKRLDDVARDIMTHQNDAGNNNNHNNNNNNHHHIQQITIIFNKYTIIIITITPTIYI